MTEYQKMDDHLFENTAVLSVYRRLFKSRSFEPDRSDMHSSPVTSVHFSSSSWRRSTTRRMRKTTWWRWRKKGFGWGSMSWRMWVLIIYSYLLLFDSYAVSHSPLFSLLCCDWCSVRFCVKRWTQIKIVSSAWRSSWNPLRRRSSVIPKSGR